MIMKANVAFYESIQRKLLVAIVTRSHTRECATQSLIASPIQRISSHCSPDPPSTPKKEGARGKRRRMQKRFEIVSTFAVRVACPLGLSSKVLVFNIRRVDDVSTYSGH